MTTTTTAFDRLIDALATTAARSRTTVTAKRRRNAPPTTTATPRCPISPRRDGKGIVSTATPDATTRTSLAALGPHDARPVR